MLESQPRRRALRIDVAEAREATAALLPINELLGPWQMRCARLLAQAERLRMAGHFEPALLDEAEAMANAVSVQRERFTEATRNLPPAIAANTRVRDTARALQSLEESISTVLSLLRGHGKAGATASVARH
ncbi:MAG TPA: hypothetical protein VIN06_00285 [Devosia sp.]